ncbi:lytic murein transglycosylase [Mesorhizobium sp. USDA-HM6]|nr:lytic murein transglycosylase [Mesorhizobium sp. USDA-HM6]
MRPGTPLCPAGHLPLRGGDRLTFPISPIANLARFVPAIELSISPLEGEMPGRPEGGV